MSTKWSIRGLIDLADQPTAENVVHLPRPTLDQLAEQAKSAISEQRAIEKDQAALNERRDENRTRLSNIQQAIVERLAEIGIEEEVKP